MAIDARGAAVNCLLPLGARVQSLRHVVIGAADRRKEGHVASVVSVARALPRGDDAAPAPDVVETAAAALFVVVRVVVEVDGPLNVRGALQALAFVFAADKMVGVGAGYRAGHGAKGADGEDEEC